MPLLDGRVLGELKHREQVGEFGEELRLADIPGFAFLGGFAPGGNATDQTVARHADPLGTLLEALDVGEAVATDAVELPGRNVLHHARVDQHVTAAVALARDAVDITDLTVTIPCGLVAHLMLDPLFGTLMQVTSRTASTVLVDNDHRDQVEVAYREIADVFGGAHCPSTPVFQAS